MNELAKTEEKNRIRARRLRIMVAAALLISTLAVAADASVRQALGVTAKQIGSGHWREAANSYVTYFNFLFRPETGATARLDIELD